MRKDVMKKLLAFTLGLLAMVFSACNTAGNKPMKPELAKQVKEDQRMVQVSTMAEGLLREGLNAGHSYNEIWIRDLNTFIELACEVGDRSKIREALLIFFKFQGEDGNIVDGYVKKTEARIPYNFYYSDLAPDFAAHKNTVETDQESSLIQAIYKYINVTGDTAFLQEKINGRTVDERMGDALQFLLNKRYNDKYGLLWGATTCDWGDIQPEHEWGVNLDESSHLAIDVYDNAMFIIAIRDYVNMTQSDKKYWNKVSKQITENVRKHLWDKEKQKFIPHIYLNGSPFPADFDENMIHYHGGTAIAIEAGLLSRQEILVVYKQMQENVKVSGAPSIGLTVYPPYPEGYFKNGGMVPYSYQNGGDWTWFGGRMVQQLIANGFYAEAYEAVSPMLDRVIKHNDFFEWWTRDGEPRSGNFRGSAGVLWKAIGMFEDSAQKSIN